jgi:hypothetical protein
MNAIFKSAQQSTNDAKQRAKTLASSISSLVLIYIMRTKERVWVKEYLEIGQLYVMGRKAIG